MRLFLAALALVVIGHSTDVRADILIRENFNYPVGEITTLPDFTITGTATIEDSPPIIGSPGFGDYLVLGPNSSITSTMLFDAGDYYVNFIIADNQTQTVDFRFGDYVITSGPFSGAAAATGDPSEVQSSIDGYFSISTGNAPASLFIDDILVSTSAIPETSTWIMVLLGFTGMAFASRHLCQPHRTVVVASRMKIAL